MLTESYLRQKYVDEAKTLREVASEAGVSAPTVRRYLCQYGIARRKFQDYYRSRLELIGQEVGKWRVLRYAGLSKHGHKQFECRCECGVVRFIWQSGLIGGRSGSCRRCSIKSGQESQFRRGHLKMPGRYWTKCRASAKSRGHVFAVTIEYAYHILERQYWRCALSGLPIAFAQHHTQSTTASMDRIDSSLGYIEGNVQWLHKEVNLMKGVLAQRRFLELCKHVADTPNE